MKNPGNKFNYVAKPGTMKGLRAYFVISGIASDAYSNISVFFNDVDGIEQITVSEANGDIYDLQGRRLNNVPQQGVYIRNGQKYVK